MPALPDISLLALSVLVSIATSYTVLVLIEYFKKRKAALTDWPKLMAAVALGSGFFAMHLIGLLTFMADYRFSPRIWLLGLAVLAAWTMAGTVLKMVQYGSHSRRGVLKNMLVIVFLGKATHFLSISGLLNVRFWMISPFYYALSAAIIFAMTYFGFRFILQSDNENATEAKRIRNASILGVVLALLHFTSINTFYADTAVPLQGAGGLAAANIALVVAVIVTLLLLFSANLALVDMRAMRTEENLLEQVKASESRFRALAYTDHLTGMPNRHWFFAHFRELLDKGEPHIKSVGIVLIDFDDFKSVNEMLGQGGGDQFLKAIVGRLIEALPETVKLARLGGDEFVFAVPNAERTQLEGLCRDIVEKVQQPIEIEGKSVVSGISMGISCQKIEGLSEESLIKQADMALLVAKNRGTESYEFFSSELLENALRKQELSVALQQALLNGEFTVHYQPQVELANGKIIGFEALLRWNSALGTVPPGEFIPVAEQCGAIHSIGEWVLREACSQLNVWRQEGRPDVHVSVNVSAKQFRDPAFARKVARIIQDTGIPPACLEIEITESVMLDMETAKAFLDELKDIGVKIAIDDFGTGYSSLNAVKNIEIDTLKIDKSLVDEVLGSDRSMAILETIIELGKNLGAEVVVEGLEKLEQVTMMREYNIIGQGYYFSRPLPPEKAAKVWDKFVEQPNGLFRAPTLY